MLESFLYVEVDRETDPALLAGLTSDLERVLGDVRAATEDWLKMLAALAAARRRDARPRRLRSTPRI